MSKDKSDPGTGELPLYKMVLNAFDRIPVKTMPEGESLTHQSMAAETDINNIMKKYQQTGHIDHVVNMEARQGDFTGVLDYQTALNTVIAIDAQFQELPSEIRKEFNNNPGDFLAAVEDPENREKFIEMGLLPQDVPEGDAVGAAGGSPEPPPATPEGTPEPPAGAPPSA